MAVVVDVPGPEAVRLGMALARRSGHRPILLFNGCAGENEVVPTGELRRALIEATPVLATLPLRDDAAPVFLLDNDRLSARSEVAPGQFDNRWLVFAQDFPSANFLRSRGITGVLLIQPHVNRAPQEDLAHVLRRWQEDGLLLSVTSAVLGEGTKTQPLQVARPSSFRALWQRAMALIGLRRNGAGGFGSVVPMPSAG